MCTDCGYVQMEGVDYQSSSAIYDESYFSHSKYSDDQVLLLESHRRANIIRPYLNDGARVLDAGCGIGDFCAYLAASGSASPTGIDISEAAIQVAKDNHPHLADSFFYGHLEDLHLQSSSFDIICSWDVIEHIMDPGPTYANLMKYLKPGGVLAISTPNIGAPIARLLGPLWAFMTPPEHVGFFSYRSVKHFAHTVLHGQLIERKSLGKWTNLGFLFYKAQRILKWGLLEKIGQQLQHRPIAQTKIYVPTGDILYAIIQKPV